MDDHYALGGKVFTQLKNSILAGEFEDGAELREISLSKKLGVSRTPVREALRQLEQEGLVTAEQGKGFYVNAQDSEMLIEQHLRKVEASLTEAIAAARIAGLSDDELKNMLDALLMVEDR